jgi:hypothetical protein
MAISTLDTSILRRLELARLDLIEARAHLRTCCERVEALLAHATTAEEPAEAAAMVSRISTVRREAAASDRGERPNTRARTSISSAVGRS